MLTAGSLFSGIGGIDVAFAAARFDIRFQVEIDAFCRKVLAKHAAQYWPNATQHVDVRSVGRAELGYVDVLFGGFPCQDISIAGKGAGIEGARSGLWYEFRRIIGEVRPRAVLLENVPAITHRGGATVIAHLTALGYDARWGIVAAADAGAPHQRDRWFCVAYANGFGHRESATLEIGGGDGERELPACAAEREAELYEVIAGCETLAYTNGTRLQRPQRPGIQNAVVRQGDIEMGNAECCGCPASVSIAEVQAGSHGAGHGTESGRRSSESRIRRGAHGVPRWLDRPRFPAGSGQYQHDWEPPRQVPVKQPNWAKRLEALGNSVVLQVAYPIAEEIKQRLRKVQG